MDDTRVEYLEAVPDTTLETITELSELNVWESERYPHVRRMLLEQPWAIVPGMLQAMVEVMEMRLSGIVLGPSEIEARIAGRRERVAIPRQGSVAVLPIYGVIAPKMNVFSSISGGMGLDSFRSELRELVSDTSVSAIVLDVDSPGGSVFGIPETADEIYRARKVKPIVAVANHMADSAAYWLASSASELVVTPSGEVGSIGVVSAHQDRSQQEAAQGVKTELIYAGKYKIEGHPYGPLDDEARADWQGRVDEFYTMFTRAVARGRSVPVADVRSGFGEGRVVTAQKAVSLGMADRIGTLESVLDELTSGDGKVRRSEPDDTDVNVTIEDGEAGASTPIRFENVLKYRERFAAFRQ